MLLDQFISSLFPEARMFLKERRVTKLQKSVDLVDQSTTTRGVYPKPDSSFDKGRPLLQLRRGKLLPQTPLPPRRTRSRSPLALSVTTVEKLVTFVLGVPRILQL